MRSFRRRDVLKSLAATAISTVSMGLPWSVAWSQQKGKRPGAKKPSDARVWVSLHQLAVGALSIDAVVVLEKDGKPYPLSRVGDLYQVDVPPAKGYKLTVASGDLTALPRYVDIPVGGVSLPAYLGDKSWPHFFVGSVPVRYSPSNTRIAIGNIYEEPEVELLALAEKVRKKLEAMDGVHAYPVGRVSEPLHYSIANGGIWIFDVGTHSASFKLQVAKVAEDVIGKSLFDGQGWIAGLPLDLAMGMSKVLVPRYYVSRAFGVSVETLKGEVKKAGGVGIRDYYVQSPDSQLIGLPSLDFPAQEEWLYGLHNSIVRRHDAELICEPARHAFPADDPDDGEFDLRDQRRHLEKIDVSGKNRAWHWISEQAESDVNQNYLGSPDITVGTVDFGLDIFHSEVKDAKSRDGTKQLSGCFDFEYVVALRECKRATRDALGHGTAVYGIISAPANNATTSATSCIAGIAPWCHHVSAKISSNIWWATHYADVLLWTAGFDVGKPYNKWPDPLPKGADVISCSHGLRGIPAQYSVDDAFQMLVDKGRDVGGTKLGVVLIYSAGNDGRLTSGREPWVCDSRTTAVSNSQILAGGDEGLYGKVNGADPEPSNWGPEVDLCAPGHLAPSLGNRGAIATDKCDGFKVFGGTSSAAPQVAGAAALVLSVNPKLTWTQVREILRCTGAKIDPCNSDVDGRWDAPSYAKGLPDTSVRCDDVVLCDDADKKCGTAGCEVPCGHSSQSFWYGFGRLNILRAVQCAYKMR